MVENTNNKQCELKRPLNEITYRSYIDGIMFSGYMIILRENVSRDENVSISKAHVVATSNEPDSHFI